MLIESVVLGMHLYTQHLDLNRNYQSETEGIYVSMDVGNRFCSPSAGVYNNSDFGVSRWVGCTANLDQKKIFRVTYGFVDGYSVGRLPLVIPSVAIPLNKYASFGIGYIPKANKNASDGIHFTFEVRHAGSEFVTEDNPFKAMKVK
ncbi:MAG TPA: hypothetical protein VFM18_24295 [Methanosarcina sp.]|nr:hypothetical protein [Methanosarcina sp.]